MRRALGLLLLAAAVTACSDESPAERTGSVDADAYGPLPAARLADLVEQVRDGATDEGGTEDGPPVALDRPYRAFAAEVEAAREAVRSAPDSRSRRLALARLYAKAGRYDLARAELGHLLAAAPEDAELHLGYGRELWYERFAIDDTLLHLRAARALGLPPRHAPELFFLFADLAETRDDLGRAERFFAKVLERDANHVEATYRLGALARARGDDDEAFRRFQRVVGLEAQHTGALFGLGQLLVKRGAVADGRAMLARHARLRKIEALGYLDRSEAFQCIVLGNHAALAGAFEEALAEFDRALALEPKNHDARSYRAATLLDMGRTDEAVAEWRRVLKKDPRHAHAATALADFHLFPGEHPAESVRLARIAVAATEERDARALAVLARALAKTGDLPGARAAAEQAVALEPGRPAWQALRKQLDAEED